MRYAIILSFFVFLCVVFPLCPLCLCGSFPDKQDPAAWGGDHIGTPVPEFVSGDECLFCHRSDVGPRWGDNRHNRTVRDLDPESPARAGLAKEAMLAMGRAKRQRLLKPAAAFGKLDLLDTAKGVWDGQTFGDRCAGCHATGVDAKKGTFTARSLDCGVCHGDVPAGHAKDAGLVHLSRKRKDSARVVTSVCAQCHARTGTSKSSGRPYANNFVAGDNLFRDFKVDFSDAALKALNPGDRHVLENVRDVVVSGKEEVTCLSCHDVHKPSGKKHHRVARGDVCRNCHDAGKAMSERKSYEVHSKTCGY